MAIIYANPGDDLQVHFDASNPGDHIYLNPGNYLKSDAAVSPYTISTEVVLSGIGTVTLEGNTGGSFIHWNTINGQMENHNITFSITAAASNPPTLRIGDSAGPIITNDIQFYRCNFTGTTRGGIVLRAVNIVKFFDCNFYDITESITAVLSRAAVWSNQVGLNTEIEFTRCTFDNVDRGIYIGRPETVLTVNECIFRNNETSITGQAGLGILIRDGSAVIKNSRFEINTFNLAAPNLGYGTAIAMIEDIAIPAQKGSTVLIDNCLFYTNGNTGDGDGGAIAVQPVNDNDIWEVTITSCTFNANYLAGIAANAQGIDIYVNSTLPVVIKYCIFNDEQGPAGADSSIFHEGGGPIYHQYNVYSPDDTPNFAYDPTELGATEPQLSIYDFYLELDSPAIDFCTDRQAQTTALFAANFKSSVLYTIDYSYLDAGYHHRLEYPEGFDRYSWTSKIFDFSGDLPVSGIMSKLISHITWGNDLGVLTGEAITGTTWQVISGMSLITKFPIGWLTGHSLLQDGTYYRITDNNTTGLLTLNGDVPTDGDATLLEGQMRYNITLQADQEDPFWFPIYDSFNSLYGGQYFNLIDVEVGLTSTNLSGETEKAGNALQFYIELYIPSGAMGDRYVYTETVQGRTRPGVEIDVKDPVSGRTVARGSSGYNGWYKIPVPPGTWNIYTQGMGNRPEYQKPNVPVGHSANSLRFGQDTKELYLQFKKSQAFQQIGDIDWASFCVYEEFLNNIYRTTNSEPYNSGLLEDGYWYVHHTYVDWLYIGTDPRMFPVPGERVYAIRRYLAVLASPVEGESEF